MQSKGIKASIAGIIIMLICILAGILYYARDTWKRESFEYPWQLSRTVREGIAERIGKNQDAFIEGADSLIKNFQEDHPEAISGAVVPADTLSRLITDFKKAYSDYFYNIDSLKKFVKDNGFDTSFDLQPQLTRLQFADERFKNVSQKLDSLLRPAMPPPAAGPEILFRDLGTRGIRSRGEYFRSEYRVLIFPRHLMESVFTRMLPLFAFLAIAFSAVLIFSMFTIKTMLKQKRLSDLKTDFINNITHEFNTPLATIAVANKILQSQAGAPDADKIRAVSAMIDRQNTILQQMVSTITQSAGEGSQKQTDLGLIYPRSVLEKLLQDFAILQQHTSFTVNSSLDIPVETAIRADQTVFINMLLNILDNAVKYKKEKEGLSLQVAAVIYKNHLRVKIADNGMGIKKEQLKNIFDKFYRIPAGDVHNIKGMGLGLYFVKKNIDALKGKVFVESQPGKGSTFVLEFPLAS